MLVTEVSCVICGPFSQPVSRLVSGFLLCCFPGEREGLTKQRNPLGGEEHACAKKEQDFSSAASPARPGATALPACLPPSILREPIPPDWQASGLTTHSPACSPTPASQTGPPGAAALRTPDQPLRWLLAPCTAVPAPPHPFVPERIRERRGLEIAFTQGAQIKPGCQLRRRENEDCVHGARSC